MLILAIVAGILNAVALCLWASCFIAEIVEAIRMRRFLKQLNKRWEEIGKIFPK